jgi:hypothetical protein
LLGQDPDGELKCVYCRSQAETWDHLISLVKNGRLQGYGHQIGNLVPCCRTCNSQKGGKAWDSYLKEKVPDNTEFDIRRKRISSYLAQYAAPVSLARTEKLSPNVWNHYCEIQQKILSLMNEADTIATRLRQTVAPTQNETAEAARTGL